MIKYTTTKPYTFNEFARYYNDTVNKETLSVVYNNYLVDWRLEKAKENTSKQNYKTTIYKEFLKNIDTSNYPRDIRNYLAELDYDDIYELDLAVHYFTVNINNDVNRLKTFRDDIKFSTTKNNLKTSRAGIEKYLKAHLLKILKENKHNISDYKIKELSQRVKIDFIQYASDDYIGTIQEDFDYTSKININEAIENASKQTYQLLNVRSKNGSKRIQTSKKLNLSINKKYSDWSKLPERFFAQENKTYENLSFILKDKIKEKYAGTEVFVLSGNRTNYTLNKICEPENHNANMYSYYQTLPSYNYGNLVKRDDIPRQLSFSNTGLAIALSRNITYNVNSKYVTGPYIIPNPSKVQPGIGFTKTEKSTVPINYIAKTDWAKNDDEYSINVDEINTLKGAGYQSKENSLKYTPYGINKISDEVSFWSGSDQINWKNADAYKRTDLTSYPEGERYEDLLITNDVATLLKGDIFGNEYVLYKGTAPERQGSNSGAYATNLVNIKASTSNNSGDTHDCTLYDGLYFDGVLSAISAANPTDFTSLTAVYDTVLYNDVSGCDHQDLGSPNSYGYTTFFAPSSISEGAATECDNIDEDGLADAGPFLNHPCKSTDFTAGLFGKVTVPYNSYDITAFNTNLFDTTYKTFNTITEASLYDENFVSAGAIYVRDIKSQKVYNFYEKLSGVFLKLPDSAQSAISAEVTNFDIIGDTIFIQTLSGATFTERFNYDGDVFSFTAPSISLVNK